ncbi:hypothetical protein TH0950_00980 [Helicobacter pylori]
MKEFKILIILIVVIGVIYYGVEPYAHSVMHPKVAFLALFFVVLPIITIAESKKQGGVR